jgi:inner membrane protein
MLNDLLHHALTGALLAMLFSTPRKFGLYFMLGAVAALLPDAPKELLDSPLFHSLVAAPFIAAFGAGILKLLFKKEPYFRLFGAFLAAVVFGHQLLDWLDNGSEIFFPLVKDELEYSLISKATPIVWLAALAAIAAGLAFKRIRLCAAAGVVAILLFIGFQFASKAMVTAALAERYPFPRDTETVFPIGEWPWEQVTWSYILKSEFFMASGYSNATGSKINPFHFYFTPPGEGLHYRVEEWTKSDEAIVIRCFDEENGQTILFESTDGLDWRPVP